MIRSDADPAAIAAGARDALKQVAPDVPPRFRTFDQIYSASLGPRQFNLTLVSVFAATALILALAGTYGLMAFNVAERRREMGVRVALGASPGRLFRLVIGQGLRTTALGAVIGTAAALGLTRMISNLLFGITPADPATFGLVLAALLAAAGLACYMPARRATRADPMDALRQD